MALAGGASTTDHSTKGSVHHIKTGDFARCARVWRERRELPRWRRIRPMGLQGETTRRGAIVAGVGALLAGTEFGDAAVAQGKLDPGAGVTAPEDLMKEHGVLNRCLLIYEEGLRRLREGEEVSPNVFNHTAVLVRRFVEEYHE